MTNKQVVEDKVLTPLINNQGSLSFGSNTQAYIIINEQQRTSVGQANITSFLESEYVLSENIKTIGYPSSSGTGSFPGPKGKAVVTWKPNAGGALLDVYIQSDNPIFEQQYDSAGNPVGAAACAGNNKHKRQGACALPGAAEGNVTAEVTTFTGTFSMTAEPTSTAPTITAMPTCYQQNQDPDQGIEQQGCVCNLGSVTKTLEILATNVSYASSCAYTALSSQSTIAITTETLGPATTNIIFCQVCSPLQDYGASCTTLPGCSPQTPTATIQIGSSPVPVGTLTSSALSATISSAIASLCPSVTQTSSLTTCDETSKIIVPNIAYKDGDTLATNGELTIQIDSSGYNDTGLLGPMAEMAALSFASSATGSNCYNTKFDSYSVGTPKAKRWYSSAVDRSLSLLPFYKREPQQLHPYPSPENIELCNSGHFASPQIYSLGFIFSYAARSSQFSIHSSGKFK